jgi:hypothetical protein
LTPSALGPAGDGPRPLVVDDLVDRRTVLPDEGAYTRWQIDWLRRLDGALAAHGAALAGAQLLKTPVDSLVVMSRLLSGAVDAVEPDALAYVGRTRPARDSPWHNGHLQPWASLGDLPLAAQLLPAIAQRVSLPFAATDQEEQHVPSDQRVGGRLRGWAKWLLGPMRTFGVTTPDRGARGTSLLLWTGGYGLRQIASEEQRQGRQVLLLERSPASTSVLSATRLGYRRRCPRVNVSLTTGPVQPLTGIDPLLAEVDEWAGLAGAGELLRSRLEIFAQQIVPTILAASEPLGSAIDQLGVDTIIAANPWSIEEFAALHAGAGRTLRVLVQHGDHAYSYASWQVSELQNFESLHTSDPTIVEDLELHAPPGRELDIVDDNPRVVRASPRQRPSRPTVCYLPMILIDEAYVHTAGYIDGAWYHRWHCRLLEQLASATDFDFVWKVMAGGDQTFDPMPDLIAERQHPNVRLETRPFPQIMSGVDALVTDYLSTGLYEAVNAGIPSLAIHFERFGPIRPAAARDLAAAVRTCPGEEAASHALREFLDGDWSTYVVPRSQSTRVV